MFKSLIPIAFAITAAGASSALAYPHYGPTRAVTYADLDRYRERWLSASTDLVAQIERDDLRRALFALTSLHDIELMNDFAMARKKFDGSVPLRTGETVIMRWQTLYFCRRIDGRWRIAGFLGYLPNPMGTP